ncbi:efflux transporter outer membrane subunit [Rubritalea marina]|uniref:efflux transporter outer membrane subunit n=1 Tax=Rubritalea marina TaxID=361055 RepID=UPI0003714DDC|nr:efflux transporter outer membrane subunit [Rubritalea marina]
MQLPQSLKQAITPCSAAAGLAVSFLSSCSLGPDYEAPDLRVSANWQSEGSSILARNRSKVDSKWWRQFKDPVMNGLVEDAYDENLNLRVAALRILESRTLLGIAQGNLLPQSQAASGNVLGVRDTGGGSPDILSASVGFDASWELDFWGKFRKSIEVADANLMADVASFDDVLISLTAEVATTYVNIRTLEERINLAQQNAKLQKESLDIVDLQFQAGTVTELDVLQAKTLLTSTQSQIPRFQSSLYQLQNALGVLLAEDVKVIRKKLTRTKGIPIAPTNIAVGVPAELLRRRPDIRRAELLAMAQSERVGIARADLYPSFSLTGFLGSSSTDFGTANLENVFNSSNVGYTFGPTFRWNILNYGRIRNAVRAEDARLEIALTDYQNTVLNAAREVEDGMTSFIHTQREAEFLRQGVESSKKSSEISMIQYKDGLTDYQRVLDSIRSQTQREDEYANARGTIATDFIAMYKALGGGWEMRDRENAIPGHIRDKMMQRTNWGSFLQSSSETAPLDSKGGSNS